MGKNWVREGNKQNNGILTSSLIHLEWSALGQREADQLGPFIVDDKDCEAQDFGAKTYSRKAQLWSPHLL